MRASRAPKKSTSCLINVPLIRVSTGILLCLTVIATNQAGATLAQTPLSSRDLPTVTETTTDSGDIPISVEAGYANTCVVHADGSVYCVGCQTGTYNYPTCDLSERWPTPVPGLSGVIKVSVGSGHACGLTSDGVLCWGANRSWANFPLGQTTASEQSRPVQVPALDAPIDVSVGYYHACALEDDSTVRCWGWNSEGQLGHSSSSIGPSQVIEADSGLPIDNVVAISSGYAHTCALKLDGTVWCWGWNRFGQLGDGSRMNSDRAIEVVGLRNVLEISVNYSHSCAVGADGSVHCWGEGRWGRLGTGDTRIRKYPTRIAGLPPALHISAGGDHTCVVSKSGDVWCWGENGNGQLGRGDHSRRLTPVKVKGIDSVVGVSADGTHTCAIKIEKTVFCWGSNVYGEAGSKGRQDKTRPLSTRFN